MSALILGGGEGSRLGGSVKAFLDCSGTTFLERCVAQASRFTEQVIVGLPPSHVEEGASLVGARAKVVAGGKTRQATLENTLEHASHEFVIVHDVARPGASDSLFEAVAQATRLHGAAAPVVPVPVRDSLGLIEEGYLAESVDRSRLCAIQTPYGFSRALLTEALALAKARGVDASSATILVGLAGGRVKTIDGDPDNIKVTYPGDLERVCQLVSETGA